VEVGTV